MNKLTTLFLTLAVAGSAHAFTADKIIGGTEVTKPNIYSRHTVGLLNKDKNTVCTGVIIEENLIFTAAHCVDKTKASDIEVSFSSTVFDKKNKYIALKVIQHEAYNQKEISNDVALIRLAKNVPQGFLPVDIEASRSLALNKGDMVTAIGYGVNKLGFFSSSNRGILRMAQVPVEAYVNEDVHVVLNGKTGKAICFGDSGGPTFSLVNEKPVLVGISSFVRSESDKKKLMCSHYSYLSNPNFFYNWIQESKLKI